MSNESVKLKGIFSEALTKGTAEERERYLAQACSSDAELRRQVDSLFLAHDQAGEFLCQNVIAPNGPPIGERPGDVIGRYKLLQKIGEGGFGVVFMAEQQEPVCRMVALKIIKAGMDTREVIARFEAERQALALMDHPNIARVLDGGATVSGGPYFVMELVKGIPITEFCERHQLPIKARLKLFMQVCAGVQHAHQKGVIHRDLKPNNVLVIHEPGSPGVPKVIDFGIAKAIGQKLTERTLFTRFDQLIGTPAYMSPEQAEWSGLDVDTRSDLYSLGVLLYELLTSSTPLEKETLARAALDEVRRMIREVEPPKPSTRLKQTTTAPPATTPNHDKSASRTPHSAIDPDLDWIVMKALEKDRSRRYETVDGLARDIERHLSSEPVLACPPSSLYRIWKLIRRNRLAFGVGSAFATVLFVGVVVLVCKVAQDRKLEEIAVLISRGADTRGATIRESGEALAQKGQFQAAAKIFALRVKVHPLDEWEWHYLGTLQIMAGDMGGYKKTCKAMLKRFGHANNPRIAGRAAKLCFLMPSAVSSKELAIASAAATRDVETRQDSEWHHWYELTKGLSLYREGDFSGAAEWMRRIQDHIAMVEDGCKDMCEADMYLVLAMALHSSGERKAEALAALARGQQIVQDKLPRLDSGDLWVCWDETCITYILLREAKALIEGEPGSVRPIQATQE